MSSPPALPHVPVRPDGRPERPGVVVAIVILDFLAGIIGGCVGVLWLVVGLASKEDGGAVVVGLGAFTCVLALLALGSAIGMLQMAPWGRTLQIVTSSMGLLACGLGTILNALVLVYLLQRKTKLLFSGRRIADMSRDEQQALASSGGGANMGVILVAVIVGGLVVVAMVGIIAAIAIPNLLNAVQRGKQKRTMSDMRTVATALEAYSVDYNGYPGVASPEELTGILVPTYAPGLPLTDAWTHPLDIATGPGGYAVRSGGKDGAFEQPDAWSYEKGATDKFVDDIVFSNGSFVRYPKGAQSDGSK